MKSMVLKLLPGHNPVATGHNPVGCDAGPDGPEVATGLRLATSSQPGGWLQVGCEGCDPFWQPGTPV